MIGCVFFFFKQKTAYEIYQCDWSSDVCSSDLFPGRPGRYGPAQCSAMSLGQSAAQNGAAAEDSASVIRRPEMISRAPARSTRSRRRRRLQPVPVALAMARRAMCMIS